MNMYVTVCVSNVTWLKALSSRCTPKRWEWSGSRGPGSGPSPSVLGKKKSCMVWKNLAVRDTCKTTTPASYPTLLTRAGIATRPGAQKLAYTWRGTTLTSRCSLTVMPATERGKKLFMDRVRQNTWSIPLTPGLVPAVDSKAYVLVNS